MTGKRKPGATVRRAERRVAWVALATVTACTLPPREPASPPGGRPLAELATGTPAGRATAAEAESSPPAAPSPAEQEEAARLLAQWQDDARALAATVVAEQSFDDPEAVWKAYYDLPERGEFETTEEYLARLPALPAGQLLYFALPVDQRYDADAEELRVTLGRIIPSRALPTLTVARETVESEYTAVNRYGHEATIDKVVGREIDVELDNLAEFLPRLDVEPEAGGLLHRLVVPLAVTRDLARERGRHVRAALVVSLDPYRDALTDRLHATPSFDDPRETDLVIHSIPCRLEHVVLYDEEARTVFDVLFAD